MVVRRVLAPPALPRFFVLGIRRRAEHVPAHDACTDVVIGLCHEVVVDALDATGLAEHGVEELGGKDPVHEPEAVLAKRRFLALSRSGAETVQGDGETTNDKLRHGVSFRSPITRVSSWFVGARPCCQSCRSTPPPIPPSSSQTCRALWKVFPFSSHTSSYTIFAGSMTSI